VQSTETSALKTLRSGFLYLSAAMATLIVVAEFVLAVLVHVSPLVGITIFFALLPSVVVVFLYAVFWKIRPGMRQLSEVDSQLRVAYVGTTLMLVGFVVLALLTFAGFAILASEPAATAGCPSAGGAAKGVFILFGALLVGNVIVFAGYVLTFVVGGFKLYRKYQNPLYAVATALHVLGALLASAELLWLTAETAATLGGILTAAGYALTYAALDSTIKKLNAQS
jgi:hypothetical protein